MGENKQWYIVCYDITDAKRWKKVHKHLHGYGKPLQYSIFRCRVTTRQLEKLRWELESILTKEDKILFIGLCDHCESRVIAHNRPESWSEEIRRFEIT